MKINANIVSARGTDEFTVREWRDMLDSRAFEVFQARLDLMIDTKLKACELAANPDEWRKAQGALESLRAVKALGGIIDTELDQRQKEDE